VFFSWDGEQVDYSDAMLTAAALTGATSTRPALPDVRDGLKPVQRRIIVAMDDLAYGLTASTPVGQDSRARDRDLSPSRDTAVYDAMVRMAQPGSRTCLWSTPGQLGNLHNEAPAAAQRYTECRLSPASTEFLTDLRPEVVAYEANFDETRQMPGCCPSPSQPARQRLHGRVAMACSVPPTTRRGHQRGPARLDDPTSPSTGSSK